MSEAPRRLAAILLVAVLATLTAGPASATATVSRAELDGSRLRIDGQARASTDITVNGVVMGRTDGSGEFRIERDPYTPPADCRVAVNDGSTSATTTTLSGCTVTQPPSPGDTTAPTPPTGLTATLTGDSATLRWGASSDNVGVVGYRIARNGATLPGTVGGTTFTDPGLPAGTFSYTVVAVDAAGNVSGASNSASVTVPAAAEPPPADSTPPSVPTNLSTTVIGTTVNLGWSMSSDDTGVTGYHVYRNGTLLITLTAPRDGYSDSGLAAGTYTYTVAAFDAAGNTSAPSTGASATVQADEGLYFITPAAMPDARVGEAYLGYIVCSDPAGPSTFRFKLVSGKVPDGTRFSGNTLENRPEARVTGTPTRSGTFSFTVEVRDNTGAVARRAFTIRVLTG